jgi:orotidine-5'-phosphate decarboxylase
MRAIISAMLSRDRLVIAIDRSSRDEILALADALHGAAGVYKIGLQAFIANGPSIVEELVGRGEKIFLDLKIHDIPNTAKHAIAEAARSGASILNVHAAGGPAMMSACADALSHGDRPLLLAVTILTSIDSDELAAIGFQGDAVSNAVRLARMAQRSGLDGVVASPLEIEAIREACDNFVILTPGIRGPGDDAGDQSRTLSAAEAIRRGATYIVVGRPITEASDPRGAALRLLETIE